MTKNIFIFTDKDMDGAGCVLVAKWALPAANIKFTSANELNFKETFIKWWAIADNRHSFDQIFICDINVAADHADILDDPKICIVDHHSNKDNIKALYKRATLVCDRKAKSSARLMVDLLSPTPDHQQRALLELIDDYDSNTLSIPASLDLNTIFYAMQGDRVATFVKQYFHGFAPWTLEQQNILKFHNLKLQQVLENLKIYHVDLLLEGAVRKIFSTFADYSVNDVARYIINKYSADITIVVNLKNKTVSFRKNKSCNYDISKLAKQLVDGGGHENAAGGVLSDKMLTFSKLFKEV
jgi:oligoribonuclease NrnB/cAMP/cGMP phosphodiesterase (DHH superfamily)